MLWRHPEALMSMCRMSALAATALAVLLAGGPAMAAPQSKGEAEAAAPARTKASAQQRAEISRMDPLARAAFWAREAEIDAADPQAGVELSRALRAMGRHEDAIAAAERARIAQPANVEALLELARGHVGRGQGFYAIEPGREAQRLAPRDWRAPALLAIAYEQATRPEEALAAHRLALGLAPDNPAVLGNLALYYAGHGDTAQAETLLRKAAAQPGAPIAVRQNLALVVGLQGRLDEAERIAREDLPPDMVENNLAWLRGATSGAARSWEDMRAP
jgi:Flp pilus assembly protein TadD